MGVSRRKEKERERMGVSRRKEKVKEKGREQKESEREVDAKIPTAKSTAALRFTVGAMLHRGRLHPGCAWAAPAGRVLDLKDRGKRRC